MKSPAWFGIRLLLLAGLLASLSAMARAADPCCGISGIDTATGVVTARENATNRTFQFHVADHTVLLSLKVGQGIYANFATKKISINGQTACCEMVSQGAATDAGGANRGVPAAPGTPCCTVAAVDRETATATARENSTGRTFQFRVSDRRLLESLRIGQPVYANNKTSQVSLNGVAPCCTMTKEPPPRIRDGHH